MTLPPEIWGRTTQKWVSSTRYGVARFDKFGGRNHLLEVIGNGDALDQADLDVLELDLRLAGLQTVTGLEGDGDGRPLVQVGFHRQGAADYGGDDGDQPDQLQA